TSATPGTATVTAAVYGTPLILTRTQVTFLPVPQVTGISESSGAAGDTLRVTGSGFSGATAVDFGSVQASGVTVTDDGHLTVQIPPGVGTVDVRVANAAVEGPAVPADRFAYPSSGGGSTPAGAPVVTSLSPAVGPVGGGNTLTISGSGFTGATSVSFGGVQAYGFTVASDGSIAVTVPPGPAGTVAVTVAGPGGTSTTGSGDLYTYLPPPTVTSLLSAQAASAGGAPVTIGGTGFTAATTVMFGSTAASQVQFVSSSEVIVPAPPAPPGTVDVTVATPCAAGATGCGASIATVADRFTYLPLPAVAGVNPGTEPTAGHVAVTITGTGLLGAVSVDFGATPAASFAVNSDRSITATPAAEAAGPIDVTVTTTCAGATATSCGTSAKVAADQLTFQAPQGPAVTAITPVNGPVSGGTSVTISGSGFTGATAVRFGSVAVPYLVDSDGTIVATSPAGSAGTVDVIVAGPDGSSAVTPADRFTFGTPPTVTGVSPGAGQAAGGGSVAITGTGFTTATAVRFGSMAAAFTVASDSRITATVPAGAGTVDVTVTTVCGNATASNATSCGTSPVTAADRYAYLPLPVVSALAPSSGPAGGGTLVTIAGTGFATATGVSFGNVSATFSVVSDTQITATAPAGTGTVNVTVTTTCASATATSCGTSTSALYTYASPAQTVVRTLHPGWNTLSIPFTLADSTVGGTFSDGGRSIVVAYAYTNGRWQQVLTHPGPQPPRNLALPGPMTGLFIYIGGTVNVTVTLIPAAAPSGTQQPSGPPFTYALTDGWNLVGPSSGNLSQPVSTFLQGANVPEYVDPNTGSLPVGNPGADSHDQVQDGYAYWVFAGAAGQVLSSQIVAAP
ncbi:MAG TPA: IPT/TIG domain-containing protein, partial [Bacillota bacterium]|nr:IPT/TIG domain-containing protein [Bacillota bacterium]